jgi:hypothetical protein
MRLSCNSHTGSQLILTKLCAVMVTGHNITKRGSSNCVVTAVVHCSVVLLLVWKISGASSCGFRCISTLRTWTVSTDHVRWSVTWWEEHVGEKCEVCSSCFVSYTTLATTAHLHLQFFHLLANNYCPVDLLFFTSKEDQYWKFTHILSSVT